MHVVLQGDPHLQPNCLPNGSGFITNMIEAEEKSSTTCRSKSKNWDTISLSRFINRSFCCSKGKFTVVCGLLSVPHLINSSSFWSFSFLRRFFHNSFLRTAPAVQFNWPFVLWYRRVKFTHFEKCYSGAYLVLIDGVKKICSPYIGVRRPTKPSLKKIRIQLFM